MKAYASITDRKRVALSGFLFPFKQIYQFNVIPKQNLKRFLKGKCKTQPNIFFKVPRTQQKKSK